MAVGRPARPVPAALVAAVLTALAVLLPALAVPAAAADEVATTTALRATPAKEGAPTTLTVTLTADGAPLAGREVELERATGDGTWAPLATVTTDETGAASTTATVARTPATNAFRARFDGEPADPSAPDDPAYAPSQAAATAPLVRRQGTVTLSAPRTVVDERSIDLVVGWRAGSGDPVSGWVSVQRRAGGRWVEVGRVRTGDDGRAVLRQRPRVDTRYRAVARALPWVGGGTSPVRAVDNLPPGVPVRLPAGAPRPRITLPPQPRATTAGADARVTRIPDGVWSSMTGVSWRPGCPVGRAGLRLVRVNYWGFDGYRHRGEVVVAAWAAQRTAAAFTAMHRQRLPIRAMYRVDRFGYSAKLRGGNDYRSMAADNTSGFNCRTVVNNPSARSPHAYGGSVDVNPWENPYLSRTGWTPNAWWARRSHPRVAWRSRSHPVLRVWLSHGFRWTYGVGDSQHFDAVRGSGRVIAPRGCTDGAGTCH
ncbi:M15 family metallopeptidase [Nocardioides perillae]|uniref:5-hydroxyisourate hydrolase-like protein (Transthyretin family) n=1 Tax=Nocardioides perillae TaxID=1119534 RepID=A0A7Y9ULM2_9ACTN|nr:M15 family metallopeptidase [Nocardioides perillae]NYG56623.1 5-hydroxyisourate hydrolase-like protein (transthyretin family) [Nocardioides perillae]